MKVSREAVEGQKAMIRMDLRELLGEGGPASRRYSVEEAQAIFASISARIECLDELGLLTGPEADSFTARARDGLDRHVALDVLESDR